jgi:tRNA uridine 5-carboxymethylaminomethyl modification enzyme
MSKDLPGFFAAGQMLGTSGYEEAAAQGIMAGINAAHYVLGREPFELLRSTSYTATLIDDLVTKEIGEPYRMMTSRSEYRLLLRQDNADERLTPLGRKIGMVNDERWAVFERKQNAIGNERKRLSKTRIHPSSEWDEALSEHDEQLKLSVTLEELLRRPRVPYSVIAKMSPAPEEFNYALELETEIKYAGYIERQKNHVAQTEKYDSVKLPADLDYLSLGNLCKEAREKLNKIRPETLGQAARMGGVSPADISVLLVTLETARRAANNANNANRNSSERAELVSH